MKLWTMLLIPALLLTFTGIADAKGKHKHAASATPHISGKVVSVSTDGTSMVVKEGKKHGGQQVTVTTDTNTAVTIDKAGGKKVSDLTPGLHVKISPDTGTATVIKAHTKHKHKHKHHKKGAPTTVPA